MENFKGSFSLGLLIFSLFEVAIVYVMFTVKILCSVSNHSNSAIGYLPNSIHAVEAMLAAASIGAIWSSTSPDFGINVSSCIIRWCRKALLLFETDVKVTVRDRSCLL